VIVVDTSVWLAGLLPADFHFRESQPFMDLVRLGHVRLHVPAHFPAEVAGVLSRIGEPDQFISEIIEMIGSVQLFTIHSISMPLGLLAADIARHARIRGSDAVFLALAAALDLPIVTWDKQQQERGKMFCRTMTPVEAMEMAE
jgi:predicted nucleic acid-binding protein